MNNRGEFRIHSSDTFGIYRLVDGRIFRVTGDNIPEGGVILDQKPGRFEFSVIGQIWDEQTRTWNDLIPSVPYCDIGEKCPDPSGARFEGTA